MVLSTAVAAVVMLLSTQDADACSLDRVDYMAIQDA
jgi:hypothetical protein